MLNSKTKLDMKNNFSIFDILFIVISAGILITLNEFDYGDKSMAFVLIPVLSAYFIGKLVGRKTVSK